MRALRILADGEGRPLPEPLRGFSWSAFRSRGDSRTLKLWPVEDVTRHQDHRKLVESVPQLPEVRIATTQHQGGVFTKEHLECSRNPSLRVASISCVLRYHPGTTTSPAIRPAMSRIAMLQLVEGRADAMMPRDRSGPVLVGRVVLLVGIDGRRCAEEFAPRPTTTPSSGDRLWSLAGELGPETPDAVDVERGQRESQQDGHSFTVQTTPAFGVAASGWDPSPKSRLVTVIRRPNSLECRLGSAN